MTRQRNMPSSGLARRLGALFLCCSSVPSGLRAGDDRPNTTKPVAKPTPVAPLPKRVWMPDSNRPEIAILRLLATHPVTAPYVFTTSLKNQKVVLRGRVGTKQAHDVAVRIAVESNIPFDDELVIDTMEARRVEATSQAAGVQSQTPIPPQYFLQSYFGMYPDPYFSFNPPVATFPPWWGEMSRYRLARDQADAQAEPPTVDQLDPQQNALLQQQVQQQQPQQQVQQPPRDQPAFDLGMGVNQPAPAAEGQANAIPQATPNQKPAEAVVEMTINSRGSATLRGTVNSLEERILLGQRIARSPGVTEVINLLKVRDGTPPPKPEPRQAGPQRNAPAPGPFGTPPPEPTPLPEFQPAPIDKALDPIAPAPGAIVLDDSALGTRVAKGLSKRPELAKLPIRVETRDSTVTLSGRVPTVLEAMLAYRAAEQTPGVDKIDDQLEFKVPEENRANPLIKKGRVEDVEPYLAAQIRRQIGKSVHLDRVRLEEDHLQIRGSLRDPGDQRRVEAILRSMAILRGFQVEASWKND